jgi:hypothetical protein
MFWSYRYMRTRANQHAAELALSEISKQNSEMLRDQAAGARWRKNADGSWSRWSYLGNDWEKAEAPEALQEIGVNSPPGEEWVKTPLGAWRLAGDISVAIDAAREVIASRREEAVTDAEAGDEAGPDAERAAAEKDVSGDAAPDHSDEAPGVMPKLGQVWGMESTPPGGFTNTKPRDEN